MSVNPLRSWLFVPGDSPRKFDRAMAGAADALILDLEDSVSPSEKPAARGHVRTMLAAPPAGKALWVRINPLDTEYALDDLAAVVGSKPAGIVLPKTRSGDDVRKLALYLDALEAAAGLARGRIGILAIVTELGEAMFGLGSYAGASARLMGLTWGAEDLAADLGTLTNRIDGAYTEPFRLARSLCLYAAAAAGVRAIDTVCVDLDNLDVVTRESHDARRDGFTGKAAIHPKHVEPINAAFSPAADEIAFAERIVAAFEHNPAAGAFRLDGKMIDRPHLRAARRLLGRQ